MPNEEYEGNILGGHNDLLISKPIYWTAQRGSGQQFVEHNPMYGKSTTWAGRPT